MAARSPFLFLAATLLAAAAQAGPSAQAVLRITAVIPPIAQFRVVSSPPVLEITPDDVRRGHVDVPLPSVVVARTNIRGGFAVRVRMEPELVAAATVTGLGEAADVAGGPGLLRVPGPQPRETRYELRWRLQLAPQATAGTYAWPVQLQLEGP